MQGARFRVQGSRFRVQDAMFKVQSSRCVCVYVCVCGYHDDDADDDV